MDAAVRKCFRVSALCLFFVYMAGLIYFLFFAESYGRGAAGMIYRCNLVPFREIRRYLVHREILGARSVALNLAGNIAGFVPLGVLLPALFRSVRRAWRTGLLCLEVSVLVEAAQLLFRVGSCDVDDVILNTIGGLLGYAVFRLLASRL